MVLMVPHLSGLGAEININPPLLEKSENIQRRLLNVREKCMNALFRDTAVISIKYRRIITTLKHI